MSYTGKISKIAGVLLIWVLVLCFSLTNSCVKFEPDGFLFVSTETIGKEAGDKGIYEFTGSIVDIGEEDISQHGFCWSFIERPLLSDDSVSLGETDNKGVFSSTVEGLKAQTTYHVRAFAVTSKGVFYGNEKSFETSVLAVPTLNTEEVTHFNRNSAVCGGEILLEGAAPVTDRGVCWSTLQNPSLADHVASEGSGAGSFKINITELELNTIYFVRAYAVNAEGIAYGQEVSFKTWDVDEFSDYDGNIYPMVVIGEQTWMRKNLRVTHYADGTPIPHVEENWNLLTQESKAYCWYNNSPHYAYAYGALYTWSAVMNGAESSDENPSEVQGVCPDGWHVPSDQEWQEMEIYLGMDPAEADTIVFRDRGEDFGGMLKETGYTHWRNPNSGATNLSGFTAVGGGYRAIYGDFRNMERNAYYWTSTLYEDKGKALVRGLEFRTTYIDRDYDHSFNGASVRCIKDE